MDRSDIGRELRTFRKLVERQCKVCGQRFTIDDERANYCSNACRYRARANRAGRTPRDTKEVQHTQ